MREHDHVIKVLEEAEEAAKLGDIFKLRSLSDQTIHSAAIYQDTDNILVAVIIYSLSKLLERKSNYSDKVFKKYFDYYLKTIEHSKNFIGKNKTELFRDSINELAQVKGFSEDIKKNMQDVLQKARINKASRVYEHGISMGATAKLLGISIWELSNYTGQTAISDNKMGETVSVKDRIKNAMEMFE